MTGHNTPIDHRARGSVTRLVFACLFMLGVVGHASAQVPVDTIPNNYTLPEEYPESWVFAQDFNYPTLILGSYIIIDVAAENANVKGNFQGAQYAGFAQSKKRSEVYVAETYYENVGHGARKDVVSIYDPSTLMIKEQIVLPHTKRALMMPRSGMTRMSRNERFLWLYNFTPGASVTVIDMEQRRVVNEVELPGCTFIYPYDEQSFFSVCGNGAMLSITLGDDGAVLSESLSESFNDIDADAMYMTPGLVDDVYYFPTQLGQVQPIDLSGEIPEALASWSLVPEDEQKKRWRPIKRETVAVDSNGRLYLLMHRVKEDGSHKRKSTEIWVYDVKSKQRIERIKLERDGNSLAVTPGDNPHLVVIAGQGFDVYDGLSGEFQRRIGGWWDWAATLHMVHAQ